jgi:hypothetical protein
MGIFFGLMFLGAVIWAGLRALLGVGRRAPLEFVTTAALVAGQLATIPLVNPTSAEFGVFFWSAIAIALRSPPVSQLFRSGQGRLPVDGSLDRGFSA